MNFKFWKENRTDQEFELSALALKTQFLRWMKTKDKDWLGYYCTQLVQPFVGDKDGLNSVMEVEDYEPLQEALADTKWSYLNSIGIK